MKYIQPQKIYQSFLLPGISVISLGVVLWVQIWLLGAPLERDEGEYAYMAQQLLQGVLPYTESLSMEFPGILSFFGESHGAIHLSLLFLNLATAFLLFLLDKNLLDFSAGIIAAICFSVLTLSTSLHGIWPNLENFVLLPAMGEIYYFEWLKTTNLHDFFSGLLLGYSLLIKQHAIFFCLFGAIYLASRYFSTSQP